MASDRATDLFLELTPERVLEAVEAAGVACRPLCYPLNSFENRVYEVELDDKDEEGRYRRVVAKFYRPERWSEEQILEEHAYLEELVADEVAVCSARPFPEGGTLRRIDDIWYSLSDRRGGRAPDELSDAMVARLGMLVGRIHNVGARHLAETRPRLDPSRYVHQALSYIDVQGSLTGELRRRYVAAAEAIAEIYDALALGVETQRIHADLHLGNVLLRDDELRILDFDDFCHGPPVQDLWLALPGRDAETLRQREIFLESYERFRIFDRSTLRLIEPLRGLRLVRYAGWLARRWHDPAFRTGWPHFGSDDYWQRETDDLEEQLAEIRRSLSGDSTLEGTGQAERFFADVQEPEELLTNKDYFWDWEGD